MAKITFTKKDFDLLKATAEANYKVIGSVKCPYLNNEEVAFNIHGLDHLKMKRWNHARPQKDQFMRLKLLHFAPEIIKSSRTLQGYKDGNKLERVKIHGRWEHKMVFVEYYEFISVRENSVGNKCRIRIVVKKIERGVPFFWSIIPYWKQSGGNKKELFEGDPEED